MNIWNYIKAANFFPKYCPDIKDWKKKITGKNGRGNPFDFSKEEKKQIKEGLKKLIQNEKLPHNTIFMQTKTNNDVQYNKQ